MITHTTDLERAQAAEIERLRAALNKIASWHEGPVVTGAFDEPHSAMTARAALGAQPAQPAPAQRLTGKRIMDIAREADMDWKRGYDLDGVNRYSTFARAIEAELMPQGWACEIAEADFEQNTVTLQMAGDDYQVSAGPHMLVPLLPMPPRDAA